MRITNGALSFDPWDWSDKDGKAREVIAFLKREGGQYEKYTKVWRMGPKLESLVQNKYGSYIDVSEPMGTKDDLEEVFGTKSNGDVTVNGLIKLYDGLSKRLDLIKYLEETNSSKDSIIDMVSKDYEEKLKTFNELILE